MSLVVAWLVLPVILGVLSAGCGLLLERTAGIRLPGALLLPAGTAVIVVAAQWTTALDLTAELTTPVIVALAAAGVWLSLPWDRGSPEWWTAGCAMAVFAVLAAPIVLSGDATFAGYIKLDDTATWLTLTDRILEHGRSLDGLAPSSYEATLAFNLADGYPTGVFPPLGVGATLTGQDSAWLFQPYVAYLGAMLALSLSAVVTPLIRSVRARALVVFIAAQPALLVGYYLWGGIKEVAAAYTIALAAALVPGAVEPGSAGARKAIPLAIVCASLVAQLSAAGGVWLVALLVPGLVAAVLALGLQLAVRRALSVVVIAGAASIPVITAGALLPPTSSPLTSETAQGNLRGPLNVLQIGGIWPTGDFRLDPTDPTVTHFLLAVLLVAAVAGCWLAYRSRAWSLLLLGLGTTATSLVLVAVGSPWVEGKALATAAPFVLLLGTAGAVALMSGGRRTEGGLILAAICAGVLWSNALAYRDVNLAPREQLAELEEIGEMIEGEGPALMTEYMPYGVRHFLRDADPEAASELRRRRVALLDGSVLEKGTSADTDRFQLDDLAVYETLVLRRAPAQSRPPLPFELTFSGDYYDVWQQAPRPGEAVATHLGLGTASDPGGVPSCAEVLRLAGEAGAGGRLAAVPRSPVIVVPANSTRHPPEWETTPGPRATLLPVTPGTVEASVLVPASGKYLVWLGGSVRPQVDFLVDGERVRSVRHQLENYGQYVLLGEADLERGAHTVAARFHGSDLHPGSGGEPRGIGPVVLTSQEAADTVVTYLDPAEARELCGRRWDWIEALRAG